MEGRVVTGGKGGGHLGRTEGRPGICKGRPGICNVMTKLSLSQSLCVCVRAQGEIFNLLATGGEGKCLCVAQEGGGCLQAQTRLEERAKQWREDRREQRAKITLCGEGKAWQGESMH